MTNTIKFADTNCTIAIVSKSFMKSALVYGTEEYKLLKEFKTENPKVTVKVKEIRKNPNKVTYKNLTYRNMVEYIETLPNSEELLSLFETIRIRAKIAKNPYRYTADWFKEVCFKNETEFNKFRETISIETSSESAYAA